MEEFSLNNHTDFNNRYNEYFEVIDIVLIIIFKYINKPRLHV